MTSTTGAVGLSKRRGRFREEIVGSVGRGSVSGAVFSVLSGGAAFAGTTSRSIHSSDRWQLVYDNYGKDLYIPQGQRVWVSPHGTWSNGSDVWVGPKGYTASQSTGFMPYCKFTQKYPFGRLIALTYVSNNNYRIWDAGYARYIDGPGWLYFRMNERDGACLKNNSGYMGVDVSAGFIK
jgi:hypothetical protein